MEKSDVVYLASPLLLVMLVVSWHGAHDVAKVLIGIMVIMIPMLYYIVYAERFDQYWVRREASRPAELYFEDTLVVVVAKIRLYASSKRDMRPMLKSLRDKVRRVQYDLVEIINLGIVKALLASYTENPDFTTNLSCSLDVVNELMIVNRAKKAFQANSDAKICVNMISKILKACVNHRKSLDNVGLDEAEHDKIIYKCILALGMMSEDCVDLQFAVADESGIEQILDAMDVFPESKVIVKWGLWSLINITMNHPPNRCDFVTAGGIPRVLAVMKEHTKNADLQMQGMGLFLNIFVDDPNAKYSVPRARESALTSGMGVLLQDNLYLFSKDTKLCAVCRKLQNALMLVWT